ncbi:MAG TPA: AraC family transcriptional regulator, partial [Rudaea sp.]
VDSSSPLTAFLCSGRSRIDFQPGAWAVICAGIGSTRVRLCEAEIELLRGDLCIPDHYVGGSCAGSDRSFHIVFAGGMKAWSEAFSARGEFDGLLPALHRDNPASRLMLRAARECARKHRNAALDLLGEAVARIQAEFDPMIARCPGSRRSRRVAVFARLQRVRNHIELHFHTDLDVEELAHMASYSLSHFITTFRQVFQETPYATISRMRMQHAQALLASPVLRMSEIGQAIGYQSRTSFWRVVRRHFGSSPSMVRSRIAQA